MNLNAPTLASDAFIARWQNAILSERASYTQHFADVCHLFGAPTPAEVDTAGDDYAFEYGMKKTNGAQGFADVFLRGHFAIEYKQQGKYKDLSEAYQQLQQYRENLNNPPLLIVCDIEHWEIHTNFTNAPVVTHKFRHTDLDQPAKRDLLRRMFADPHSFHPEQNKLQITEAVAAEFKYVVDDTLEWRREPGRVARFMTQLVFGMFVEDIGLLPKRPASSYGILTEIVRGMVAHSDGRALFPQYVRALFKQMATGGNFHLLDIPYFNGSMFTGTDDDVFRLGSSALGALNRATDRNWAHVEPTIFGTIFERTLDVQKRAQLGAHYTSPADILLIVEPVLMQPLRRAWDAAQAEAAPIRDRWQTAPHAAAKHTAQAELIAIRDRILGQVRTITVLDPACGSGNFLYISLQRLLDLEKEIITSPLWAGLKPAETIQVHPRQLYGMEVNEIAQALASVVVWIGYLQWQQDNGFFVPQQPILSDLSANIRRMDAILSYDADGTPREPDWQPVDVIVGNPPFLGGNQVRAELGDQYTADLRRVYDGRVPGGADLVTYWFERARAQIELGKAKAAMLLATNSIRQVTNRPVLERIKQSGGIFHVWSDREWVLDGANVRVAIIGFDDGSRKDYMLDDLPVTYINADLRNTIDITRSKLQIENRNLAFMGTIRGGKFDISAALAQHMLSAVNVNGNDNADVVRPAFNATDIVARPRNQWVIDFGIDMPLEKAQTYERPFQYLKEHVYPERQKNRRAAYKNRWWIHVEARPGMRRQLAELQRFIVTPLVSKHRIFTWLDAKASPDARLIVFARADDYFFGVLHSRVHEMWTLRQSGSHGVGNDPVYNKDTTFETFPFPFAPGKEDAADPRVKAISAAAKMLHEERNTWLNPEQPHPLAPSPLRGEGESSPCVPPLHAVERGSGGEVNPREIKDRTLTNLYNALVAQRAGAQAKGLKASAVEFAPRLAALHDNLDRAVLAAYGWDDVPSDDALLGRLLALNQARAAGEQDTGNQKR